MYAPPFGANAPYVSFGTLSIAPCGSLNYACVMDTSVNQALIRRVSRSRGNDKSPNALKCPYEF